MRPVDVRTAADADAAVERLGKWRSLFSGWLLGTRPLGDAQSDWARDNSDRVLALRAEVSALARILIDRGVCTTEELRIQIGQEAVALSNGLAAKFPGVTATDTGLEYDLAKVVESGWMKDWLP